MRVALQTTGKSSDPKIRYSFSLINANGSTLITKPISNNASVNLNTASYPAGVYLITLKGSDGTTNSTKVIKINQ